MERITRRLAISVAIILLSHITIVSQSWIDESFEDLSKGALDAAGQNIYVRKQGGISTIRRFDIDRDGYLDLLFNNTHDDDVFVAATFASVNKDRAVEHTAFPVDGSISASVADLNMDGFPDIVFCPNQSGIQNPRRLVTIMWGGADGWSSSRMNGILPVNSVSGLAVADVNGDGWLDIATLNSPAWLPGQPSGNIIRIYHGGPDGFLLSNFRDIGIEHAIKIAAGDLDGDGRKDLAVLAADNSVTIIRSGKAGSSNETRIDRTGLTSAGGTPISMALADSDGDGRTDIIVGTENEKLIIANGAGNGKFRNGAVIEGISASSITAADVDGDGNVDLITSKFVMRRAAGGEMLGGAKLADDKVTVYWGDNGRFAPANSLVLDVSYTASTAVADIDGDGIRDIVCAVHQGERTYAAESPIFYGKGGRRFERGENGIPSEGASHAAVITDSPNSAATVVISNSRTGTLNEAVPLVLYYGSKDGFNAREPLRIPFASGYESSAADLNADGFVDLVSVNSGHAQLKDDPYAGINIFWGGKNGFDPKNSRTVLSENLASTSNIADLNKDGYLDIVVGFFNPKDGTPTDLVIYYGSENGYSAENRQAIASPGRSGSPNIADYDLDGRLDIAVTSYIADRVRIFYQGEDGFSENSRRDITVPAPIDLETADLNGDGFADLIVPTYKDRINDFHDTGVLIFWGGKNGFKHWNSQRLPSLTALGPTVADFDGDGRLDLFLPAYLGDNNRQSVPMYLYWGNANGFSTDDRTEIIGDSGSDAFAADLDNDGLLDLVIAEHAKNSGHRKVRSRVHYNDADRFRSSNIRVESLLAMGTHWIWNYDLGHILHRRSEQTYTSPKFTLEKGTVSGTITAAAEIPSGGELEILIRSAEDAAKIDGEQWFKVENSVFTLEKRNRIFQYRLIFRAGNGDNFPLVKSISVDVK